MANVEGSLRAYVDNAADNSVDHGVGGNAGNAAARGRRRYTRNTYLRFSALWRQASLAPITRPQAARLCEVTMEGVRKVLVAMIEQGHLDTLPRGHCAEPLRYVAAGDEPPPPHAAREANAGKRRDQLAAELECTRARFAAYPPWLLRIPQSLDAPRAGRAHLHHLKG